MGIDIRWDNAEQTIILITFDSQWTWDDFEQIDTITDTMLSSVDHKVCYLVDISRTKNMPSTMSMSRMRRVLDLHHPNSDLIVMCGMSMFLNLMLDTATRAMRSNSPIRVAKDMAEARAILAEHQAQTASTND